MTSWTGRLRQHFHPLWRLRRSRGYRWLVTHADWPVPCRIGSLTAYAYLWRDWGRVHPAATGEPRTAAVFCALLRRRPCDCLVDIGAHVGGYTWLAAGLCPEAHLLLFEPDLRNQLLLRRTLARARLARAELHPCALSDRTGTARFVIDGASGATGSLLDQRGDHASLHDSYRLTATRLVATRPLDDFLPALRGRRVVVKVDVEGTEAAVFAGATQVLREVRPLVFYESFAPDGDRLLAAAGYRTCSLQENSNYLALPVELAALADEPGLFPAPAPRP